MGGLFGTLLCNLPKRGFPVLESTFVIPGRVDSDKRLDRNAAAAEENSSRLECPSFDGVMVKDGCLGIGLSGVNTGRSPAAMRGRPEGLGIVGL